MRFSDITRAGTGSGTIQTVFLWAALVIHLISLGLYWEVYWSIAMSSDCSFNEPSHFIFILIQQFNSLTNCSSTLITGKLKDSVIYKLLTYAYIFIIKISLTSSFSSVQFSRGWLFATPWTAVHQASLSITNSRSPPKPMSIVSAMPFNHLILCHPLLLPSIFPSIRVFSNESALCIRWPKYWSLSFNISPSKEHPGLISFRTLCLRGHV